MPLRSPPDTDIGRIRQRIGDNDPSTGPKPGGGCFTDPELQAFLDDEGTWQRAAAAAFESLAGLWATTPTDMKIGPLSESYGDTSARYSKLAEKLRGQFGMTPGVEVASGTPSFSGGFARAGNSEAVDYV